jgi:hypothetical protein
LLLDTAGAWTHNLLGQGNGATALPGRDREAKVSALLLAAALLPAALLAQNVDVGVAWDPVPPETIPPDTTVQLCARVTVHASAAPLNVDVCFIVRDTNDTIVFSEITTLTGMTQGVESLVTFPWWVNPAGLWFECSIFTGQDTYPANDVVWWRPAIRNAVKEPEQPALLAAEPRPLSSQFSRQVVIHCRQPTPVFIYDACGTLVRTLAPAREVVWDGRDRFGRDAPAGVYSIRCGPGQGARMVKTR